MFYNRNDEEIRVTAYLFKPESISSMDRLTYYGETADRAITDCKNMIKMLEAYNLQLHERAQQLTTAPYHFELELRREKHWNDAPVIYFLTLYRVYDVPGIQKQAETQTRYKGTERSKALKDFEALKKARPGITATLDIAKRSWER